MKNIRIDIKHPGTKETTEICNEILNYINEKLRHEENMQMFLVHAEDSNDGKIARASATRKKVFTKEEIGELLKTGYGMNLPEKMRSEVSNLVNDVSKRNGRELTKEGVYRIFSDYFMNTKPIFQVREYHFRQANDTIAEVTIAYEGEEKVISAIGNGHVDAVSNAIKQYFNINYELFLYEQHSLTKGTASKVVAYVGIAYQGRTYWGVGIERDLIRSSVEALIVAVNKIQELNNAKVCKDDRMLEIMSYIQENYMDVTLDSLSKHFYLSKPYVSKYIKEKTGVTFGELVKNVRMKKARALLRSSHATVENISQTVGYHNVEHFNRLFKKEYQMTPMQYRNQK